MGHLLVRRCRSACTPRGGGRRRLRLALVVTASLGMLLAPTTAVAATPGPTGPAAGAPSGSINGLAQTPYLGWNTYYGLGSNFNEQAIKSVADAMVSSGLKAAGYQYVWIDGG